jgi:hypothetical protein
MSVERSHVGSLWMMCRIVRPLGNLWMTVEDLLAFVDRLLSADLASGLTSHACLPVCWPGGTFGLDLDRPGHARAARKHQAAPKSSVLNNRTPARADAGKEGTRPWPSSQHDSFLKAVSISGIKHAVGIRR